MSEVVTYYLSKEELEKYRNSPGPSQEDKQQLAELKEKRDWRWPHIRRKEEAERG
ncbi:hypothetical protein [Alteribacter populi]|uniref:hypothetical protein n=1 Tax=Alteribacter populi TaxID=2011011 RepID=UPI0012FFC786|nr:hypothetical protein [Alteribacter populi]